MVIARVEQVAHFLVYIFPTKDVFLHSQISAYAYASQYVPNYPLQYSFFHFYLKPSLMISKQCLADNWKISNGSSLW